jgi:GTP pyrophosphokinase
VEVLTSSKQKPTDDWLRIVVSTKAKSKIKDALKEARRSVVEDGKEILKRKLKQIKIDLSPRVYDQLRVFFSMPSNYELNYRIGRGTISVNDLRRFKDAKRKPVREKANNVKLTDAKSVEKELTKAKGQPNDILLIGEDMNVVEYKLAKCCTPIPGDEVFGFVTVNEGIKIHRINCTNAPELMANHGNRIIKSKWTSQHEVAFLTGLKVIGTDRVGLINDVSKIISEELKVNMSSLSFRTEGGIFDGEIMLYVNDTRHLDLLIKKLEKVEGVVNVSRFDSRLN